MHLNKILEYNSKQSADEINVNAANLNQMNDKLIWK
jgi:hypothetical protein